MLVILVSGLPTIVKNVLLVLIALALIISSVVGRMRERVIQKKSDAFTESD